MRLGKLLFNNVSEAYEVVERVNARLPKDAKTERLAFAFALGSLKDAANRLRGIGPILDCVTLPDASEG